MIFCKNCSKTHASLLDCTLPHVERVREADRCVHVVYTALIGAYDDFEAFSRAHEPYRQPGVCYVAIMDAIRSNRTDYWKKIVRQKWDVSNARSAHLLKPLALFLFPLANWIIYLDAKTTLTAPPVVWMREASGGEAGLVVLRHPHRPIEYAADGLAREIVQERRWVARRRRANWKHDVLDIDRLAQRYCALGPLCQIGDVIESSLMAWNSYYRPSAPMRLLACAWFREVLEASQREQLSFPFVVSALGAREHVRYLPSKMYRRSWGWLQHLDCTASGVCKTEPAHAGTSSSLRAPLKKTTAAETPSAAK